MKVFELRELGVQDESLAAKKGRWPTNRGRRRPRPGSSPIEANNPEAPEAEIFVCHKTALMRASIRARKLALHFRSIDDENAFKNRRKQKEEAFAEDLLHLSIPSSPRFLGGSTSLPDVHHSPIRPPPSPRPTSLSHLPTPHESSSITSPIKEEQLGEETEETEIVEPQMIHVSDNEAGTTSIRVKALPEKAREHSQHEHQHKEASQEKGLRPSQPIRISPIEPTPEKRIFHIPKLKQSAYEGEKASPSGDAMDVDYSMIMHSCNLDTHGEHGEAERKSSPLTGKIARSAAPLNAKAGPRTSPSIKLLTGGERRPPPTQAVSLEGKVKVENLSGAPRSIENMLGEIQVLKLIIVREETLTALKELMLPLDHVYKEYGRAKEQIIRLMPVFYSRKYNLLLRASGAQTSNAKGVVAATKDVSHTNSSKSLVAGGISAAEGHGLQEHPHLALRPVTSSSSRRRIDCDRAITARIVEPPPSSTRGGTSARQKIDGAVTSRQNFPSFDPLSTSRKRSSNLLSRLSDLNRAEKAHSRLLLICDKASEEIVFLQEHLVILLDRMRLVSLQVIDAIQDWRTKFNRRLLKDGELNNFHDALRWRGENYLLKMRRDLGFLQDYPVIPAWFGLPLEDLSLPLMICPDGWPSLDARIQGLSKSIGNALRQSQVVKKKREARILRRHMHKVYGQGNGNNSSGPKRRTSMDQQGEDALDERLAAEERQQQSSPAPSIPPASTPLAATARDPDSRESSPKARIRRRSRRRSSAPARGGNRERRRSSMMSMDTPPMAADDGGGEEEEDLREAQGEYEEYQSCLDQCIKTPHLLPEEELLSRLHVLEEPMQRQVLKALQVMEVEAQYEEMKKKAYQVPPPSTKYFSLSVGPEEEEEEGHHDYVTPPRRATARENIGSFLRQRQLSPVRPLSSFSTDIEGAPNVLLSTPTCSIGRPSSVGLKVNPQRAVLAVEKGQTWVAEKEDEIVVHRRLDGETRNLAMILELKSKGNKAKKRLEARRRALRIKEVTAALTKEREALLLIAENLAAGAITKEKEEEKDEREEKDYMQRRAEEVVQQKEHSQQQRGIKIKDNYAQMMHKQPPDHDEDGHKDDNQLQHLLADLRNQVAQSIIQAAEASRVALALQQQNNSGPSFVLSLSSPTRMKKCISPTRRLKTRALPQRPEPQMIIRPGFADLPRRRGTSATNNQEHD